MRLLSKLRSFRNAGGEVKILFIRAFFLSAAVRFTMVFLPFKKILAWKGVPGVDSPAEPDPGSLEYRRSLQAALQICAKYTPWKNECYTQALTGKILLSRKGLPGTIYVGFRKNDAGVFEGHAWLRSCDRIICGGAQSEHYTIHSFYS
jgi:hypothetical protein